MPFHFLTFFCFAHPLSVTQARVLFTSGQPHVTAVESLCYFLLLIHFPLLYFLFSSLDMITHILTLKHTCTYDCMWNGLSITQLKCFRDAKMVTLRTFGLNDLENLQRHVALEMVVVNSNLTLFCSKDYNIVYAKKKKKSPIKNQQQLRQVCMVGSSPALTLVTNHTCWGCPLSWVCKSLWCCCY